MKATKKIKVTRALPSRSRYGFVRIDRLYMPPGYYHNRPTIKNPYRHTEIGIIEGFSFIVSPTL